MLASVLTFYYRFKYVYNVQFHEYLNNLICSEEKRLFFSNSILMPFWDVVLGKYSVVPECHLSNVASNTIKSLKDPKTDT